ncbi:hypothetical protein MMC34_002200 [Xylographa carneopallida]|nr:hypothetical protein [Xylographa carneopallida]
MSFTKSVYGNGNDLVSSPLDSLSRTSRRLRDISLAVLFRKIIINGDWTLAVRRLEEMREKGAVFTYVRSFKFNLDFLIDENDHPPPKELVHMLSTFLSSAKRLQKLWLAVPGLFTEAFASHFESVHLLLPDIKTLVVGPYCHFAVAVCPNVRTISVNGHAWRKKRRFEIALPNRCRALLNAACNAPKLAHLVLHEWYIVETLEDVLEAVPWIRSLSLAGEQYEDKLPVRLLHIIANIITQDIVLTSVKDLLTVISRFTNLQYLALDSAIYIKLGDQPTTPGGTLKPGLDCKPDRALPEVGVQYIDPIYCQIVEMVTRACKRLKVIRIGKSARAEIKRYSDGRFVEVAWYFEGNHDMVGDL